MIKTTCISIVLDFLNKLNYCLVSMLEQNPSLFDKGQVIAFYARHLHRLATATVWRVQANVSILSALAVMLSSLLFKTATGAYLNPR